MTVSTRICVHYNSTPEGFGIELDNAGDYWVLDLGRGHREITLFLTYEQLVAIYSEIGKQIHEEGSS